MSCVRLDVVASICCAFAPSYSLVLRLKRLCSLSRFETDTTECTYELEIRDGMVLRL